MALPMAALVIACREAELRKPAVVGHTRSVSTTAAVESAIAEAHAGDSILLAAGTYSGLSISNLNVAGGSVTIASQNAGVDTLVPIDPTALPDKYYESDQLHLNPEGAALFTSALAEFLPQTILRESMTSPD